MAERHESAGGKEFVEVFRRLIDAKTARQVIDLALPYTLENKANFDDESGNRGYIYWNFLRSNSLAEWVPDLLSDVSSQLGQGVLPTRIRAVQFNVQKPRGYQDWHTDDPWTDSVIFHLSPEGKFDFQFENSPKATEISASTGDAIQLHGSGKIRHRGRNGGSDTRYTLALFFVEAPRL